MQNRFKFRVWDKELGEILYPEGEEEGIEFDGNGKLVGINKIGLWNGGLNCIPQQCTGLKDKNGKLIYEGDVVRIFHVSGTMQGKLFIDVVEWNELRCRFDTEKYGVFDEDDTYEVIGNIYENPVFGKVIEM